MSYCGPPRLRPAGRLRRRCPTSRRSRPSSRRRSRSWPPSPARTPPRPTPPAGRPTGRAPADGPTPVRGAAPGAGRPPLRRDIRRTSPPIAAPMPVDPSSGSGRRVRLALCQVNATVGDIAGNEQLILAALAEARAAGAQLAVFPELTVTGYPPEDLLLKSHFLRDARAAVDRLAAAAADIVAIVGFPEHADGDLQRGRRPRRRPGGGDPPQGPPAQLRGLRRAALLPGRGRRAAFDLGPHRIGLTVCEDVWEPGPAGQHPGPRRGDADPQPLGLALPRGQGRRAGASSSPGGPARTGRRSPSAASSAARTSSSSTGTRSSSTRRARSSPGRRRSPRRCSSASSSSPAAAPGRPAGPGATPRAAVLRPRLPLPAGRRRRRRVIAAAARLGRGRDLRRARPRPARLRGKNGFADAVLGLSGGIDSALVAAIAVDALGPDRVTRS